MHGFGIHVTHCSIDQIFTVSYPFKSNLRSLVGSFPGSSVGKEPACSVGYLGSIPGSGRSPGEGNGKPLQYSSMENPMDTQAWQATLHGVAKHQTQLSDKHFHTLANCGPCA